MAEKEKKTATLGFGQCHIEAVVAQDAEETLAEKAERMSSEDLGLHGLQSTRLLGLYSKQPLAQSGGFGFASFD